MIYVRFDPLESGCVVSEFPLANCVYPIRVETRGEDGAEIIAHVDSRW